MVTNYLTKVEIQPEVGEEAYDIGANLLYNFFRKYLAPFNTKELLPLGRQIIECGLDGGTVTDYDALIPVYAFSNSKSKTYATQRSTYIKLLNQQVIILFGSFQANRRNFDTAKSTGLTEHWLDMWWLVGENKPVVTGFA